MGRAPLTNAPLVLLRIAVRIPLRRAVPALVTGHPASPAAGGGGAVPLIAEMALVGKVQLPAVLTLTPPVSLPRILCFHGANNPMKPDPVKSSGKAEEDVQEEGRRWFISKLFEENPEEETRIFKPAIPLHFHFGGRNRPPSRRTRMIEAETRR